VALPLAHVAGMPVEETLGAALPVLAAVGTLALARVRAAVARHRGTNR
jgi:hypothetical protein